MVLELFQCVDVIYSFIPPLPLIFETGKLISDKSVLSNIPRGNLFPRKLLNHFINKIDEGELIRSNTNFSEAFLAMVCLLFWVYLSRPSFECIL